MLPLPTERTYGEQLRKIPKELGSGSGNLVPSSLSPEPNDYDMNKENKKNKKIQRMNLVMTHLNPLTLDY